MSTIFPASAAGRREPIGPSIFARRKHVLLLVFLSLVAMSARWAWAGDETPKPAPLTAEQIDARVKQVEEARGLDEQVKQKVLELYEKARKELQLAERWRAKKQGYDADVREASNTIADAQHQREALAVEPEITAAPDAPLGKLSQMRDEAETQLKQLQAELVDARGELRRRKQRRAKIPGLIQSAKQCLAEIEAQLKSQAATDAPELLRESRGELLQMRAAAFQEKMAAYKSELAAYEATSALVPLQRDLAALRVRRAETKVKALREAARAQRRLEIYRQIEQAQKDLEETPPTVRQWAEQNTDLSAKRETLNEDMERAVDALLQAEQTLADLTQQHQRIKEQIDMVGLTNVVGRLLRDQRITLPDLRDYRRRAKLRQEERASICSRLLELDERQEKLGDMDRLAQDAIGKMEVADADHAQRLDFLVRYLLGAQKQYLDQLIREYNDYYEEIVDLESVELQLIAETEDFSQLIEEHVLWIRTSLPLDSSTLRHAGNALTWLCSWRTWNEVARSLTASPSAMPLVWLVALLIFLPLLFFQTRMRRAINEIGGYAAKGGAQRFMPTAEVFVLTVLLAVPWPGLLWFLAGCLFSSDQLPGSAKAIAHGFSAAAFVVFPIELLRQVCRRHGLAEVHFGWPAGAVAQLRRRLGCFIVLGLPFLFVAATFHSLADERWGWGWDSSLGRLTFVVFMTLVVIFMHRVLRPSGAVLREFIAEHPDGWLAKTRRFWYMAATLLPVLLILLALLGYYYAAWHFAARLMATVWLLLGLLVVGALLLRWVLMVRRRLAITHAQQRRELAQAAGEDSAIAEEEPVDPATLVPEVDLAKLNEQTRQLVYGSLAAACILGVCLIWADVLPALNILRQMTLWHTVVPAGQEVGPADAEGGAVRTVVEQYKAITLADLSIALVGVLVTVVLARNFPGLLEFLLLQHLPMDSGLRHALTTVSRYVIVLVGIFFVFSTLGVSWSKVQWLVAGVSVGLGFGLQEIFANFVSGLVILFERPIRVGDVITIGDATGKVARIQMRATTITDWDRKELVVPNKEFITGRLLNWTLTDKTNRVTVNVGVAYGSDPDRVREILLEIAKAHEKVLDSPSPIAICNDFGSNSLNFSLRVYLPSMVGRLTVIHQLHAAIHKRFRQEGIEIAFPQLDLHVRSFGSPTFPPPPETDADGTPPESEFPKPTSPSDGEHPDTADEP